MNFDYLKKNESFARPALLGVSAVLAVLTAVKVWEYRSAPAQARSTVARAVEQVVPDPEAVRANLARFTEVADSIKKENLFVPPAAKRHPVSEVLGIMGSEALINGQWYKVGDKISDAEIVAVEPTLVKIKWDGEEKTFAPISAITAEIPMVVAKIVDSGEVKEEKKKEKPEETPKVKKIETVKIASIQDPLAWMGMDLPPHLRDKVMKLWNNASEEDKRRGMAEWNNASDEKRREMLGQLEAMPEDMDG